MRKRGGGGGESSEKSTRQSSETERGGGGGGGGGGDKVKSPSEPWVDQDGKLPAFVVPWPALWSTGLLGSAGMS